MTLIKTIVAAFEEALLAVFEKEAASEKYMKQTILGCKWRAFWGIVVAFKNSVLIMVDILTLAIAEHRQEEHGEDNEKVIAKASRSLTEEQVSNLDAGLFWN